MAEHCNYCKRISPSCLCNHCANDGYYFGTHCCSTIHGLKCYIKECPDFEPEEGTKDEP